MGRHGGVGCADMTRRFLVVSMCCALACVWLAAAACTSIPAADAGIETGQSPDAVVDVQNDGCGSDEGGLTCPLRCNGQRWCGGGVPRKSYCVNDNPSG